MGGTKRKIPMQKIEKKSSRAVAFSKRRKGLYGKASELCLLSGSSIAILATPISSNPNTSFYSFGHSSVDSVVSAFLENKPPREDLGGLGFWWEDESLLESEDLDELRDALDSISMLMNKVKGSYLDLKEKKNKDVAVLGGNHQSETLNFDSSACTSTCIQEDFPANSEGVLAISDKKINDMDHDNLQLSALDVDKILAISDKDNNNALPAGDLSGCIQELDLDQIIDFETNSGSLSMNDVSVVTTNQYPCFGYGSAEDGGALVMYRDLEEDHFNFSSLDKDDQFLACSDNNNNNNETRFLSASLDGCNQEFDLDEIFDFETKNNESLLMKMDDASMMNTESAVGFDDGNLQFSDVFNELDSITAL